MREGSQQYMSSMIERHSTRAWLSVMNTPLLFYYVNKTNTKTVKFIYAKKWIKNEVVAGGLGAKPPENWGPERMSAQRRSRSRAADRRRERSSRNSSSRLVDVMEVVVTLLVYKPVGLPGPSFISDVHVVDM